MTGAKRTAVPIKVLVIPISVIVLVAGKPSFFGSRPLVVSMDDIVILRLRGTFVWCYSGRLQ